MKLTYEQKLKAYKEWDEEYKSPGSIAKELGINISNVKYFLQLAKRYGADILKHGKNKYYSKEEKERIIKRVLINNESIRSVSLDEGLCRDSLLTAWIKSYKENSYNVIEKKRGRKSNDKQENNGAASSREQNLEGESLETRNRELILKKIGCLNSRKRKVTKKEITKAVNELRQELNCSLMFILDTINANPSLPHITRSDYYYHLKHQDKDFKHDDLMNLIIDIFYHHKSRYGYRRITLELINRGFNVNHKTVKRLMTKMGLYALTPRAKYKSYKGDMNGTVKNLLLDKEVDEVKHKTTYVRNFTTSKPNEKWTTDVSEFHIRDGKLYLSPILDMYNGEIISYNLSTSPNFNQTLDMLNKAFDKHPNLNGLIFHSDQGWQYQMTQYHKILQDKGIIQSMSRKGNCLDNCVMENFFGKLKNEMFYGHEYEFNSINELKQSIDEYIYYYNNERIQVKLKGLTPCQARDQALQLAM